MKKIREQNEGMRKSWLWQFHSSLPVPYSKRIEGENPVLFFLCVCVGVIYSKLLLEFFSILFLPMDGGWVMIA